MIRHNKRILIIGMFFCYSSTLVSEEGDLSEVIKEVAQSTLHTAQSVYSRLHPTIKQGVFQGITSYIAGKTIGKIQKAEASGLSYWHYFTTSTPKLSCTTANELSREFNVQTNEVNLPEQINKILDDENNNQTGQHKLMLLYGKPGTGKTTLAKQIALKNNAEYFHVHQDQLNRFNGLIQSRLLRSYIAGIADQTKDGQTSVLHIEEGAKQFIQTGLDPAIDKDHAQYQETWKSFLQDMKQQHPNVLIITCTNQEKFDSAMEDRMHAVHITNPTAEQKIDYLKSTCKLHLHQLNNDAASYHTKNAKTQLQRNQELTQKWHVTSEMHQQASNAHKEEVKNQQVPYTFSLLVRPWLWQTAWEKNTKARDLKNAGYFTPIVTYNSNDLQPGVPVNAGTIEPNKKATLHNIVHAAKKDSIAQKSTGKVNPKSKEDNNLEPEATREQEQGSIFIKATENYSYRKLDEKVVEQAQREALLSIKRAHDRSAQQKDKNTETEYKNPTDYYQIDSQQRTTTVEVQDIDGKQKTITYPYGNITRQGMVNAATEISDIETITKKIVIKNRFKNMLSKLQEDPEFQECSKIRKILNLKNVQKSVMENKKNNT